MTTIITLRSGAVIRFDGDHVIVNGDRISRTTFFIELIDAFYRLRLDHPRGSGGWFTDLTGLDLSLGCALCGNDEARTTGCPTCSISRCAACAVTHDDAAICLETRTYADIHRQMRDAEDLDPRDFYFARRAMAPTFLRRGQH